ncbi:glycosyltransferase [Patescibacteria group bacterium]|nr:glycosyltransferase [Patescibacteria group bacterium]
MKILVVGDFHAAMQEKALADAFEAIGCETTRFKWAPYFKDYLARPSRGFWDWWPWFYYRVQNKFLFGPVLIRINHDLVNFASEVTPDLIFIYHGTHIFGRTVSALKRRTKALVFLYNNDDPFGRQYPRYFWRHFLAQTSFADYALVFRKKNVDDYKAKLNFTKTAVMLPDYIEAFNHPIEIVPPGPYLCDVSFVGHYEHDDRDDYILEILRNNFNFKLFGPNWPDSPFYDFYRSRLGEIRNVPFEEYNLALNSTKIALVFLSKLNSDTYTRRCLEIPAAGTFMLSTYTDDLNRMFKEGKEAEYFRTTEEMAEKIKYYLAHDDLRRKIAAAGRARLLKDGHETKDRARQVINLYRHLHQ